MAIPPPITIDDVLEAADDGAQAGPSSNIGSLLRSQPPRLVLVAGSDGVALLADDFESGVEPERAGELAVDLANRLVDSRTCQFDVETEGGTCLALAIRLSESSRGTILAALLPAPPDRDEAPDNEGIAALVCSAFAWAASRYKAREGELLARTEQLKAGQEALKVSYARTLASAVEEREERLREQQEHTARLQAVMMAAAEGIVTIDERGKIESFNAAAARIFGYPAEEVIGRNVSILMPAPHSERHDEYLRRYLDDQKGGLHCAGRELIGRRKDGSTFPLELAISEAVLGERRVFTGILRDITDRKQAEQELKRLHFHNKMILDSAGEGIVGLDGRGYVAFVNPAVEDMVGWTSSEMVGKRFHDLVHHTKRSGQPYAWSCCPLSTTLREGAARRVDHEAFWHKDGNSFPVEYVTTPMRQGRDIVGAVLTFQDVTERRMLEGQLVQAQKLESIGQLAAGIAHEINTPTQFIGDNMRFLEDAFVDLQPLLSANQRLHAALAADRAEPRLVAEVAAAAGDADLEYVIEEIPTAIGQSLEGVERVANIVRAMKEFSHPGSEEMQPVDLNRAIENTLTVCRNEWKYVADVVTEFDPDLPTVHCLPNECNQVFLNLIINAAHAIAEKRQNGSTEKGTITISTRRDGDWVEVRVADTGTGIPEACRRKVFDPFFTTKEVGKGTGQGLAIARSVLADKHGGTLSFETVCGEGTRFVIRLPRRGQSSSNGAQHAKADSVR